MCHDIFTYSNRTFCLNDVLIFNGTDHLWAANGNANAKFLQAIDFFSNFLYPLLPCNQVSLVSGIPSTDKKVIKIVDLLGRQIKKACSNTPAFYLYEDGSVERKIIIQ